MIEEISYRGWPHCYHLYNERLELIATGDVGPRIIRFGFLGDENEFAEFEEEVGLVGGDEWRIYGGHRFWHSPEARPRSYYPDNQPIKVEAKVNALRLTQPIEETTSIRKETLVELRGEIVVVTHTLRNVGLWPIEMAPWALSVMAPGGTAIVAQPTTADPDSLLPNRIVVLWPYTDTTDPRLHLGSKFVTLRQDPEQPKPIKFGINSDEGWIAYLRDQHLFVKRFAVHPGARYPDYGCTIEAYTNDAFLEAETLGPLSTVTPGQEITHVEHWHLFDGVECDTCDEGAIERIILPLVKTAIAPEG